ncbi:hypothetical protein F2P81_012207 [Scophthalmus maximus]|uniref:Uncharacterized protein n=1 Tax=Scophthalmus maximus TaxID=52904 RepID=A0A6A4SP22_SCOMX|nr:hypothetical protein F2P81_012207 [Scophthalmus maximus]
MLCNYGYEVERCFNCPYGNGSHVPEDYEGWTNSVIKDTMAVDLQFVRDQLFFSGLSSEVQLLPPERTGPEVQQAAGFRPEEAA